MLRGYQIGRLASAIGCTRINNDTHTCISVNFKSDCQRWAGELEDLIGDRCLPNTHMLQINGDMDKNEKFTFISIYTSYLWMANYYPRVLVVTAAANAGIDQPKLI